MSYLPKTVFLFFSKKKNGITYQERESQDTKVLFFSLPSSLSFLPSSLFSLSATLRNDWKTAFKEKVPWVSLSDTTSFIGFSELMVIFVWRIFIPYLFLSFSFLKHSCFPDFAFEGEKKLIVSLSIFLSLSYSLSFKHQKCWIFWNDGLAGHPHPSKILTDQLLCKFFNLTPTEKEVGGCLRWWLTAKKITSRLATHLVPLSFLLSLFLQTSLFPFSFGFLSQFLLSSLSQETEARKNKRWKNVFEREDRQKEEAVGAIRTIVSMTCRLLKSEWEGVTKKER